MVAGPARVETPSPSTPDAVLAALAELVVQLGPFRRMSIGFPGVVRRGRVLTAPNLGTANWHDFALAEALGDRLSVPRGSPMMRRCRVSALLAAMAWNASLHSVPEWGSRCSRTVGQPRTSS